MGDNATAHAASDYEKEVAKTIPFHAEILRTAIDVALAAVPSPSRWLDTGAGPGALVELARAATPKTDFTIADPSRAMLDLARARHADLRADRFVQNASEDLPDFPPFDVITAIQCHHYGDAAARARAVARCRDLLAPGGAFVTFENVRAETEAGHALQRARWARWMRDRGRDADAVQKALAREGTAFFPIAPSEHLALLTRTFGDRARAVEMIWRAYGQAGFVVLLAPASRDA